MKRLLLMLALLLLVAALGSHWYLVRQAEASMNRLASLLAPVGQLSWENIRVNRHGEARVERLELRLPGDRDPVSLELLRFNAGGPLALRGLSQDLTAIRLPAHLWVDMAGLKLPVNRELDRLIGEPGMALPHATAGCADYANLSFYDLGELDLIELNIDFSLNYQLVNQEQELDLRSRVHIHGLNDRRWRLRLAMGRADHSLTELGDILADTQLLNFEHDYIDLGYYPRLLAFCASRAGLGPTEQIDRHLQAWDERWQNAGLAPGPLVLAGYRHFLHQPQSLSIRTRASAEPARANLAANMARLVLAEMDATFSIDEGIQVSLNFEPMQAGMIATMPPPRETIPAEESSAQLHEEPDIELGVAPGWVQIELSLVSTHIGQRARIRTHDGQDLSGRIAAVDDDFLHLTSRSRIGEFTRPVALSHIERLEVRP